MIKTHTNQGIKQFKWAFLLSATSMILGVLREFLIVFLFGFSAKNDHLQLYLSICYTIGLSVDAIRLSCLNLFSFLSLHKILLTTSFIAFPFSVIIGLLLSYSTDKLNFLLLIITIFGSYLSLMAVLLITYKQRNNIFLSSQIIHVLPNFILIPGIIVCYAYFPNYLIGAIVCLTSAIPLLQCLLLLFLPIQSGTIDSNSNSIYSKSTFINPKSTFINPKSTFINPKSKFIQPKSKSIQPNSKSIQPKYKSIHPKLGSCCPEKEISIKAAILILIRHFSAGLGEQGFQIITRAAFFNYATGYLSIYAFAIRVYSAARFILIDSFIVSRLSNWQHEKNPIDHFLSFFINLHFLSFLTVVLLLIISLFSSNNVIFLLFQALMILGFWFYFSTLVRVAYFKINHYASHSSLVTRFSMMELLTVLFAYLLTKEHHYPIFTLLWIGYIAKPFCQLSMLRRPYLNLSMEPKGA
jgi:hypothetical protein